MKKNYLIAGFLLYTLLPAFAQQNDVIRTDDDVRIFSDYISKHAAERNASIGELMVATGKYFLETPYVAKTLELSTPEKLIVNLRELDCTTLVETCLALSRTLKNKLFDVNQPVDKNFEIFTEELRQIRYRGGKIDEYPSRLHYTSDWIYDNQKAGIVKNVTKAIGGIPRLVETGIMSKNPDKYIQLKDNPLFISKITATEALINARKHYYIPKANVAKRKSGIQSGDMIAFTTNIPGLDTSHVGLAVWENNELYLLHASLSDKKVILTSQSLAAYTQSIKSHTGIMVVRPQ